MRKCVHSNRIESAVVEPAVSSRYQEKNPLKGLLGKRTWEFESAEVGAGVGGAREPRRGGGREVRLEAAERGLELGALAAQQLGEGRRGGEVLRGGEVGVEEAEQARRRRPRGRHGSVGVEMRRQEEKRRRKPGAEWGRRGRVSRQGDKICRNPPVDWIAIISFGSKYLFENPSRSDNFTTGPLVRRNPPILFCGRRRSSSARAATWSISIFTTSGGAPVGQRLQRPGRRCVAAALLDPVLRHTQRSGCRGKRCHCLLMSCSFSGFLFLTENTVCLLLICQHQHIASKG
jgi:hypothetical protein